MARRYLGAVGGDRYVAENPDRGRENVAFRMRPEHWLSQDQGNGSSREESVQGLSRRSSVLVHVDRASGWSPASA